MGDESPATLIQHLAGVFGDDGAATPASTPAGSRGQEYTPGGPQPDDVDMTPRALITNTLASVDAAETVVDPAHTPTAVFDRLFDGPATSDTPRTLVQGLGSLATPAAGVSVGGQTATAVAASAAAGTPAAAGSRPTRSSRRSSTRGTAQDTPSNRTLAKDGTPAGSRAGALDDVITPRTAIAGLAVVGTTGKKRKRPEDGDASGSESGDESPSAKRTRLEEEAAGGDLNTSGLSATHDTSLQFGSPATHNDSILSVNAAAAAATAAATVSRLSSKSLGDLPFVPPPHSLVPSTGALPFKAPRPITAAAAASRADSLFGRVLGGPNSKRVGGGVGSSQTRTAATLPTNFVTGELSRFLSRPLERGAAVALGEVVESFFEQVSDDLVALAAHAGRSQIEVADAVALLKRQGTVTPTRSLADVARAYLPRESVEAVIPCATAHNVVAPADAATKRRLQKSRAAKKASRKTSKMSTKSRKKKGKEATSASGSSSGDTHTANRRMRANSESDDEELSEFEFATPAPRSGRGGVSVSGSTSVSASKRKKVTARTTPAGRARGSSKKGKKTPGSSAKKNKQTPKDSSSKKKKASPPMRRSRRTPSSARRRSLVL